MRKKLKKKYLHTLMQARMKNIIYMVLIVLTFVVAGLVGMFLMSSYRREKSELRIRNNQELVEQMDVSMYQYIHNIIRLSDTMYYNVVKDESEYTEQMFQAMYDGYKDYVESIALFRTDGTLVHVMPAMSMSKGQEVWRKEWFNEAISLSENVHFFGPQLQDYFEKDEGFPWVISMSRYVQMVEEDQVIDGVLLINIKYSALSEIFRYDSTDGGQYAFLMDNKGQLIYHPQHALINSGFVESPQEELAAYPDGDYEEVIGGEKAYFSIKTVGYTGWKIVSVINQTNLLKEEMRTVFFMLFIVFAVLLFAMLFGNYLSAALTNPLKNLEMNVKRIAEGELDIQVESKGSFEVQNLAVSIQKMVIKIRRLMEAIIREQEEKRKSELNSLQAQMTPHFLYNTLEIIVWLIEANRKEDATETVTSLARFLRISLSKGKHIITVADELEHVRNYLKIQTLRFKDQFSYRIEKGEDVEGLAIIKLVVQPIVENAIYHGMSGMQGDGEILIRAYREGDCLYISVKDNGMGMTEERLEELLDDTKELKQTRGNGLGVRNVQERIRLYFGAEYGLQIISEVDVGTEVILRLPAKMYGEHEK